MTRMAATSLTKHNHNFSMNFQLSWICVDTQKSGYYIILFWFENPAIWLGKGTLVNTWETRFFPNIGFVEGHSKFKLSL